MVRALHLLAYGDTGEILGRFVPHTDDVHGEW